MLARSRPLPAAFVAPCLPSPGTKPPSGPDWLHEIKHDGYRLMAWREGARVRLFTRNGFDWADRYPAIVEAVGALKVKSCLIDGEVIVTQADGLASFDKLRSRRHDHLAVLCAFDLLAIDGEDLRREPIEARKQALAKLLKNEVLLRGKSGRNVSDCRGIALNEHFEGDGTTIFDHACQLGCEGIVTKRKGSRYRSGKSNDWIKSKHPDSVAVRREETEDWGR